MPGHGGCEGVVGFDQGEQGVFVRSGVVAVDVFLHRAGGGGTSFGEFLDQVVREDFGGWCGLD